MHYYTEILEGRFKNQGERCNKGFENLLIYSVLFSAFQNTGFSTCIYNQSPAAEYNPQLSINMEILNIIKRSSKASFKQTALMTLAAAIVCENLVMYGICLHLSMQHSLPSTKLFGDGKVSGTVLW